MSIQQGLETSHSKSRHWRVVGNLGVIATDFNETLTFSNNVCESSHITIWLAKKFNELASACMFITDKCIKIESDDIKC